MQRVSGKLQRALVIQEKLVTSCVGVDVGAIVAFKRAEGGFSQPETVRHAWVRLREYPVPLQVETSQLKTEGRHVFLAIGHEQEPATDGRPDRVLPGNIVEPQLRRLPGQHGRRRGFRVQAVDKHQVGMPIQNILQQPEFVPTRRHRHVAIQVHSDRSRTRGLNALQEFRQHFVSQRPAVFPTGHVLIRYSHDHNGRRSRVGAALMAEHAVINAQLQQLQPARPPEEDDCAHHQDPDQQAERQ